MRILTDTHLLLWAAFQPDRLSERASALLSDVTNEVRFSAVSIWEIAIKTALPGRPEFQVDAAELAVQLTRNGWLELPVTAQHAAGINVLPDLHRDPFDRVLIAQAHAERLTLLTRDRVVAAYPGQIELV